MILRRSTAPPAVKEDLENKAGGAVVMFQVPYPDLYYLADIAEKAGEVTAIEILGSCPHSVGTMALFGDVASVNAAADAVKTEYAEMNRSDKHA